MTSLHVTPAHLYPWVDLVSVFGGVGKVGRHFLMETNFQTLIDQFSKIYGILVTVKLNATG